MTFMSRNRTKQSMQMHTTQPVKCAYPLHMFPDLKCVLYKVDSTIQQSYFNMLLDTNVVLVN